MASDSERDYEEDYEERSDDGFDAFDPEALEDDTDIHAKREETLEERFEAARSSIKRKRSFTNEEDVDEFLYEYREIAGKSSSKAVGNLLHVLVEVVKHNDEVEPQGVERLVRELVKRYPDLLKYTNNHGLNPIFMAIRAPQDQLINYMISACAEDKEQAIYGECLRDALSMKQDGKTCLHAALNEKLKSGTIRMLFENASDEALEVQDDRHKTPMHYAVSFRQCTDARTELIELLIQRDLSVRSGKTFLDLLDRSGSSVYREHQKTRISFSKRWSKENQATDNIKRDQPDSSRTGNRPTGRDPKPQGSSKESKHIASTKAAADRVAERNGRGGDERTESDDREKLRQQKKDEERARLEGAETQAKTNRPAERDTAGRDASRNRSTRINEPDENAALQASIAVRQLEPVPNTGIKRSNTARPDNKADPEKEKRLGTGMTPRNKAMAVCEKNSDKIMQSLKLHYMRTRSAEMAISFLYGTNMDDIQISFDYDRLPRNMLWQDFTKRFGQDAKSKLRFDPVLQYVTFPRVEVRSKGRLADRRQGAEHQSGIHQHGSNGRKDMKYFLDWLYDKGVRHIIKLSVEDSGDDGEKVHSDQVIQDSLERFVVEHLDWQKTDLDPETILHISSKVSKAAPTPEDPKRTESVPDQQLRKLSLRWSGSNAVLRAWSEPDALPLLPRLQKVEIIQPPSDKMYDSPQWISNKIKEFGTRLDASRKIVQARKSAPSAIKRVFDTGAVFGHVEVIAIDSDTDEERRVTSGDTPHISNSAPSKGVNAHQWLKSTAKFAGLMDPFWKNTVQEFLKSRKNQGTPERVEDDVVLALIDDGVDMFDTSLSNQILEGKSFDFHDKKVRPPFSSAKGHGTVMASMILRVCPMAKVYPIRLKTYDNANGKNNIDTNYAAQAIQAALDKKATIISMSWTLPITRGNDEAKNRLHAVIQKAVDNKVLMFCSAPDEGKFTDLDYPSGPWRDRFFRIGAARADGTVFQWTPEDGITYVFPGVDVILDQVKGVSSRSVLGKDVTDRVNDFKYETGSSVATALAAGLAAMIIYCVKASILAVKTANQKAALNPIPDDRALRVADPDAMKRAFASLGKLTPNRFIQVWEELDKVSEILETWQAQSSNPEVNLKCTQGFMEFGLKLASSVQP
ncbi:hypothetical protein G7Z17_g2955 [Cylindrodendrum hubeiense]|uniref:Peptidase S8/S53 domain-containing protein n=1 Tax=Cylindrodendrum hubeiense TaxID=595255 RepID=A0A9P5HBR8_9HYPO|nr:hypothetical protein G7Z17_g2955 [Cylindrodendrum hubeiense]